MLTPKPDPKAPMMSAQEILKTLYDSYKENMYSLLWIKAKDLNGVTYEGVGTVYNGGPSALVYRDSANSPLFNGGINFTKKTYLLKYTSIAHLELRALTLEEEADYLGKPLKSLSRFKLNNLNVLFWDGVGNRTGPLLSYNRFMTKLTPPGKLYASSKLEFQYMDMYSAPAIVAGGISGDCGSYVMTGFGSDKTISVRTPILHSAILSEFLFRLEWILAGGGYVLCSCPDWNVPNTVKGYSINKIVNLIGQYSSGHVYSNNMNHTIYPLNKPGEKGHFRNPSGRNHWVNIMTFDGLRQFYEGPEFQEEILPVFYDWWGLQS